MSKRKETTQEITRYYLRKLEKVGDKYGLGDWVRMTINANKRNECEATEKEAEMLARIVNDERIKRTDVAKAFNMSYRQCVDKGIFDKLKKLPKQGIYSKVNTIIESEVYDG